MTAEDDLIVLLEEMRFAMTCIAEALANGGIDKGGYCVPVGKSFRTMSKSLADRAERLLAKVSSETQSQGVTP